MLLGQGSSQLTASLQQYTAVQSKGGTAERVFSPKLTSKNDTLPACLQRLPSPESRNEHRALQAGDRTFWYSCILLQFLHSVAILLQFFCNIFAGSVTLLLFKSTTWC